MTNDVKQTIIKNILSDFDNVIIEFIGILITSKQTAAMINIINKFLDLSQKALNAEQVEVITAEPLADDMLASLREKMNCKVKSTVDKSIIGGIKIKYENKIFDNSIVCQLNQLKKTLHNV
jgi:F-type H+-transporting ATPase subunit delta